MIWLAWGWVNAARGVARTAPLIYLMPPFVISPEQLAQLCRAVVSVLGGSGQY